MCLLSFAIDMIRFFKDERFKYTLIEYLYPFLIFASLDIISIILISLFKFWNFFNPFSSIKLIVVIGFIIVLIFSFIPIKNYLEALFYCHKVDEFESICCLSGHFNMTEGRPGVGKSLTIAYIDYIKAKYKELDITFNNHFIIAKENIKGFTYNCYDDYWLSVTLKQSYEFYKNNKGIPFLTSNYGIREKDTNRYSYKLEKEHFLQVKRLAEGSICSYDEFARDFNCKDSMTRDEVKLKENEKLNDFSSKLRHYGNFYVDMGEQECTEVLKDVRRVTDLNRKLLDLSKILESKRLSKKINKIKSDVLNQDYCTERQVLKYEKLQKKFNKIGFIKIYFEDRGAIDKSSAIINEGYYVIPKNLPFEYETRCFFFDYEPLIKKIDLEPFEGLYNID